MRFVTYSAPAGPARPGVETADGSILDVGGALGPDGPATVARLMGAGPAVFDALRASLARAEADPGAARDAGTLHAAAGVRRHAPLGERVLLVCAGANYRSHLEEMGGEPDEGLAWFVQNPNSLIGDREVVRIPREFPQMIDFEGELCLVFDRPCHAVKAEDALAYVGGYTVFDDISARDKVYGLAAARTPVEGRYAWTDMLLGKQFPTFGPMGPAIVTADEVIDPTKLRLTTTVNGVVMQDANTDDLVIGIAELIEKFSRYFCFQPGDAISTGTPGGVGAARTPPRFLRPGDTVEVEVESIGRLTNTIAGPADEGEAR